MSIKCKGCRVRLQTTTALVITLSTLLAACGSSASKSPSSQGGNSAENSLVAQARAEGQVTLYCAMSSSQCGDVAKDFEGKYGITVNVLPTYTTGALETRFLTEAAAGSVQDDVFMPGENGIFSTHSDLFLPVNTGNVEGLQAVPGKYKGKNYVVANIPPMVVVSAKSIPETQAPQKWTDLVDPKWKGKIVLSDPRGVPAWLGWLYLMEQHFGPSFLQKLGQQNFTLVASGGTGAQQVAAGEKSLAFPAVYAHISGVEAADRASLFGNPGAGFAINVAVARKASHPAAARLLLSWIISRAGQEAINGHAYRGISVLDNIPGAVVPPPGFTLVDTEGAQQHRDELLKAIGSG